MGFIVRPKVVCFDLGGVLVRICRSFAEAVTKAGLPVRHADELESSEWLLRRRQVMQAHQVGELCCEEYCLALADALEHTYTAAELRLVHDAWTLEEYEGVGELLDELNAVPDLLTACLSNTNDAHWLRLSGRAAGALEYPAVRKLKALLASHELGLAKPDPRIYRAAQERFGCEPEAILFFDDSVENVEAARTAGWHAECVDPHGSPARELRALLVLHRVLSA
jgi:HAD superfamily hydrolase (TIGR01509 family)